MTEREDGKMSDRCACGKIDLGKTGWDCTVLEESDTHRYHTRDRCFGAEQKEVQRPESCLWIKKACEIFISHSQPCSCQGCSDIRAAFNGARLAGAQPGEER